MVNTTTTLICSFDFDGCTDTQHARTYLIKYLKRHIIQYPALRRIVCMIGSLRQSVDIDNFNAEAYEYFHRKKVSCSLLGLEFMDELKTRLRGYLAVSIGFAPLLSGDIYNNLNVGDTFDAMKKSIPVKDSKPFVDHTKISLLYSQVHYMANQYERDESITYIFFDDQTKILDNLYTEFSSNSNLIPKNFTLKFVEFKSDRNLRCGEKHILGSGGMNQLFHEDLQRIRDQLSPCSVINLNDTENIVSLINQLNSLKQSNPNRTVSRLDDDYVKLDTAKSSDLTTGPSSLRSEKSSFFTPTGSPATTDNANELLDKFNPEISAFSVFTRKKKKPLEALYFNPLLLQVFNPPKQDSLIKLAKELGFSRADYRQIEARFNQAVIDRDIEKNKARQEFEVIMRNFYSKYSESAEPINTHAHEDSLKLSEWLWVIKSTKASYEVTEILLDLDEQCKKQLQEIHASLKPALDRAQIELDRAYERADQSFKKKILQIANDYPEDKTATISPI